MKDIIMDIRLLIVFLFGQQNRTELSPFSSDLMQRTTVVVAAAIISISKAGGQTHMCVYVLLPHSSHWILPHHRRHLTKLELELNYPLHKQRINERADINKDGDGADEETRMWGRKWHRKLN